VAHALDFARGARKDAPGPYRLMSAIEQFGVRAVLGREVVFYGETRQMMLVTNIINAWQARKRSGNFATWADANPHAHDLLAWAEKAIHE